VPCLFDKIHSWWTVLYVAGDPIWHMTSRSSEIGFPWRAISTFTFLPFIHDIDIVSSHVATRTLRNVTSSTSILLLLLLVFIYFIYVFFVFIIIAVWYVYMTVCSATGRLVSCAKCEKFYIVSNDTDSHSPPQNVSTVDSLSSDAADKQPFPKYRQPPVPTKVSINWDLYNDWLTFIGSRAPSSTSNCLIFLVTSEPHKLWHWTLIWLSVQKEYTDL